MLHQTAERRNSRPHRAVPRARPRRSAAPLAAACALALLAGPAAGADAATYSFGAPTSLAGVQSPQALAVADVNGDGKLDLIAIDGAAGDAAVYLGKGDGTFPASPSATYPTAAAPGQIAAADLNGDGRPDLVATDATGVSVLLNAGNGTFGAYTHYATSGAPAGVAVGDLNKDGRPDIVLANPSSNAVTVLLNTGAGAFGAAQDAPVGADLPHAVALGDFNGDGKLDVAAAEPGANAVSVLPGDGSGALGAAHDYPTGTNPESIVAGDFNGDGKTDLATADGGANAASVLLGKGDGTFPTHVEYPTGSAPAAVAVADLNADGKPDLVTANGVSTASTLLGKGDGTFAAKQDVNAGAVPDAIALGDLNGDGEPDIVTASDAGSGSLSVVLNTSTATADLTGSIAGFGSVLYGTKSAAQKVTLTNNGAAVLKIGSVTVSGNFTASGVSNGATLTPGAKLTLSIVFAPKGYGVLSGSVTIATSAGSPKLSLAGTGIPAPARAWTNDVSGVAFSYATLNGTVNSQGPGSFYFEYGPTTAYGTDTPSLPLASSALNQLFAATIPVAPGEEYHYQLVATNNVGTVYGGDQVFDTQPDPPAIGSAVGNAHLAGALRHGIGLLVRLDSAGTVKLDAYIPAALAVSRRVISHAPRGVRRVWLGTTTVTVGAGETHFALLRISRRAARLLGRLGDLKLTIDATAQAHGVVSDVAEKQLELVRGS